MWHLDEVFLTICGEQHYLWRAVDQEGKVLDILVQRQRERRMQRFKSPGHAQRFLAAYGPFASGGHGGRIRIGLRQCAAPQSHGNLLGVETVILGFAPVDGLHVWGVPQHKRQPFLDAHVGQPGPR